jgi:NADPH:quinone reductase-like Zn-dependent oxidoreductase
MTAQSALRSEATSPLADAHKAHERAAQGHIQGKTVLTVV